MFNIPLGFSVLSPLSAPLKQTVKVCSREEDVTNLKGSCHRYGEEDDEIACLRGQGRSVFHDSTSASVRFMTSDCQATNHLRTNIRQFDNL
ncbi:hypothetical protein KCU81_g558, partial [Aureobasidium melanogenum]